VTRKADGYKYMTLDKLIEATRPILNRHGLAIVQAPTTLERKEADGTIALVPALATRIMHEDSKVEVWTQGEAIEYTMPLYLTDKSMQGLGSAITYARRYAWASALGIAAEEDTDAKEYVDAEAEIPF
jgi:ERF superfamily